MSDLPDSYPSTLTRSVPSLPPNSMPLASLPTAVNTITAKNTGTMVTTSANG